MKLFGLFLISLAPISYGFYHAACLRRLLRTRVELARFFNYLRDQIDFFSKPQEEIYRQFENAYLERIGFLPQLRSEYQNNPCGAMERAVEFLLEAWDFSVSESEALRSFSGQFGMLSKEAQISDCDRLITVLEAQEKEKRKTIDTDIRLSRLFGLTVGIGIFILLL